MSRVVLYLVAAVLLLIAAPFAILLLLSAPTQLSWSQPPQVVGRSTPVAVKVDNPHGVRELRAYLEQNGQRQPVLTQQATPTRWFFFRTKEHARTVSFPVGSQQWKGLKDGPARLVVEAVANDFRAATSTLAADITVNTKPPAITPDGLQHYITQGGAELVKFTVSGYWTEAGVRVGPYTFRSFPLPGAPVGKPGEPQERFSLFAYPWDVPATTQPVVFARNPSGTEATATFWHRVKSSQWRERSLEIKDQFLSEKVPELDPEGQGELVARFVKVNSQYRKRNNETLAKLRDRTEEKVLWEGAFQQLSDSQVEAKFADVRTYVHNGKQIDKQVHLGFDLSKVKNTPIVAANSGKIVLAETLGIYGKCVVIDHGYGLQSIYAHLNDIGVQVGQAIQKGQEIGKSGRTGMAGGDHLHYSMQVDGVQVNPMEWWDAHWIRDRIATKLPLGKI